MTYEEAMQAAVTALAANISESIPEQNYEHEFVARIVLEAVGYDDIMRAGNQLAKDASLLWNALVERTAQRDVANKALRTILEMAERSDAHPDLEFARVARDALEPTS